MGRFIAADSQTICGSSAGLAVPSDTASKVIHDRAKRAFKAKQREVVFIRKETHTDVSGVPKASV
jgi:hypothetical protein